MPYETDTLKIDDAEREHAVYKDGEVNEATMFTPKSKVGRCASCDAVMSDYNKIVEQTTGNADYALMKGTWEYTALTNGTATKKIFVDVKESKTDAGVKSSSEYVIVSTYTAGKGWTTGSAGPSVNTTYDVTTGVRSLKVIAGGVTYWISEKDGAYTLKDNSGNDMLKDKKGTLYFHENHNHLYSTDVSEGTDANAAATNAKSIYADSYFTKMTFLGQNLMDEDNHYVSCSECGITNYPVAHKTSDHKTVSGEAVCTCGYTQNTDSSKGNIYRSVYIYSAEAKMNFANYETALTKWASIDPNRAVGTSGTAQKTATAIALEAATAADDSVKADGTDTASEPSGLLLKLATALDTLMDSTTAGDLNSNRNTLSTAATNYDSNYDKAGANDVSVAVKKLYDLLNSTNTVATESVATAVDGLAKEIAKAAQSIAKTAVNEYGTEAETASKSSMIDHFVVLKGTVLSLDYTSYTTSGNCKITFVDNYGWMTAGTGAQLTAGGYKVIGDTY